ncbi:MAG: nitrilase-related carbon-nitrogen hydrolase [Candidatus Micrarchaeia archaeon]
MVRVAFAQTDPKLLAVEENIARALALIRNVRADLIVLPELFSTGYNFKSRREVASVAEAAGAGPAGEALLAEARRRNCMIVAGFAERQQGKLFNSALIATPEGFSVYRKTHLFGREKLLFSPGDTGFRVVEWRGARIGVMICFDWFFPESARTLMLKGAEVIAHPANLVLPWCPEAMRTRCLENMVFAVTASRVGAERGLHFIGRSQITGTQGEVIYRASANREEVRAAEIDPKKARDKRIGKHNHIIRDRREELYHP